MIGSTVEKLMLENRDTFLIPAANVANVMEGNPLEHGLLVLSKVGYSKIPVLDRQDHFVGLLSLTAIVNKMMESTKIDSENLSGLTVADVMETDMTVIHENWELEDVLHDLVDAAFLPVVDDENVFKGIITRRELLKAVNRTAHELERENVLIPKVTKLVLQA